MRYSTIKRYDISNGRGIHTSIFFQGCAHACEGCFNSELWDFNGGKEFDEDAKNRLFTLLSDPHCSGLSVLGGEPLQQGETLTELLKEVKDTFPDKDIWLWTGYYLSELNEYQMETIKLCDYVIDGRFELDKAEKKLLFRGSSNQTVWENDGDGNFKRSELNDKSEIKRG